MDPQLRKSSLVHQTKMYINVSQTCNNPLWSVLTKVSRLLAISFKQTRANAVHSSDLIHPL